MKKKVRAKRRRDEGEQSEERQGEGGQEGERKMKEGKPKHGR